MDVGLIVKAAAMVTAIGTIGGGVLVAENRYAPMSVVDDMSISRIFDLVGIAKRDGRSDWICRAIEEEVIKLCSNNEDHYLCRDEDAIKDLKEKAGCD